MLFTVTVLGSFIFFCIEYLKSLGYPNCMHLKVCFYSKIPIFKKYFYDPQVYENYIFKFTT